MTIARYYLGCPIWSQKSWVGELFSRDTKPADFLQQYSSVFNTVEGNTTFYGIPSESTVERWKEETPATFRFCFKFPRSITHNHRLIDAEADTALFLDTMAILGSRLGPFFLQLPPSFDSSELPILERYLRSLPEAFDYAVEVRHPDFFDESEHEQGLNSLLASLGIDRVCFDVRALRASALRDTETLEAQRKKPDVPARQVATGDFPFVRYIADTNIEANMPLLAQWAEVVAGWVEAGRTPYFFTHAPDDFYAPRLARHFHHLLAERLRVGSLPPWPAESDTPPMEQLHLF